MKCRRCRQQSGREGKVNFNLLIATALSKFKLTKRLELPPCRSRASVIRKASEVPFATLAVQSKFIGPLGGSNSKASPRGINP